MTDYRVVFRHEALQQLEELYDYIANAAHRTALPAITDAIITSAR